MKKLIYVLISLILFSLISCATSKTVTDTNSDDVSTAPADSKIDNTITVSKLQEKFDYLETDISYPQFEGKSILNKYIENTILNYYKSFKISAKQDWDEIVSDGLGPAAPFVYSTEYEYFKSKKYTSVLVVTYLYTGGAHGNYILYSYNYNEETKTLDNNLSAIINKTFEEISDFCRKDLIKQLKNRGIKDIEQWIKDGTEPNPGNFEIFKIKDKSVEVYFEPYKVAPYSEGIIFVEIPSSF